MSVKVQGISPPPKKKNICKSYDTKVGEGLSQRDLVNESQFSEWIQEMQ